MSTTVPDASPRLSSQYEIGNALGRLNSDRPALGQRCTEIVPIARAIRFMLHALDLHQQNTGHSLEKIASDIRRGRIEIRFEGSRAKVITP
jgi:hypothetical protein